MRGERGAKNTCIIRRDRKLRNDMKLEGLQTTKMGKMKMREEKRQQDEQCDDREGHNRTIGRTACSPLLQPTSSRLGSGSAKSGINARCS